MGMLEPGPIKTKTEHTHKGYTLRAGDHVVYTTTYGSEHYATITEFYLTTGARYWKALLSNGWGCNPTKLTLIRRAEQVA
jgi:hypothetical protein